MGDLVKNKNAPTVRSCPLCLEVSPYVDVKQIKQIEGVFKQEPEASRGLKSVDIDHKTTVEVDKEKLLIFVFVEFELSAKLEETLKPVVFINAKFLIVYQLTELKEFTNEHFSQFAELNGIYNAWPYWREYVQSATVRMGLPALTVPVFLAYKPQESGIPAEKTAAKNQ